MHPGCEFCFVLQDFVPALNSKISSIILSDPWWRLLLWFFCFCIALSVVFVCVFNTADHKTSCISLQRSSPTYCKQHLFVSHTEYLFLPSYFFAEKATAHLYPISMNIVCWNCRGLGKPAANHRLKHLSASSMPSLLFLVETKSNSNKIEAHRKQLHFDYAVGVDAIGRSGGLCLVWNDYVDVNVSSLSTNWIHYKVSIRNGASFLFTGVYGPPKPQDRFILWNFLLSIDPNNDPWLLGGDFN